MAALFLPRFAGEEKSRLGQPLRRWLLGLIAAVLATAPASVSAAPASAGNSLYLSTVGVPIISNGRLVNYILVRLSLTLRPGTDVSRLTEKEPYFREALVRLAYRTHLNPVNSFNRVDPALISAKMLPLCQEIAGAGVVTAVEIKYQEPQNRLESPTPAATPAPRPEP
jgi:hypothetical protein